MMYAACRKRPLRTAHKKARHPLPPSYRPSPNVTTLIAVCYASSRNAMDLARHFAGILPQTFGNIFITGF